MSDDLSTMIEDIGRVAEITRNADKEHLKERVQDINDDILSSAFEGNWCVDYYDFIQPEIIQLLRDKGYEITLCHSEGDFDDWWYVISWVHWKERER